MLLDHFTQNKIQDS